MRIQSSHHVPAGRRPALALIGTWDPLTEAHRELFRQIVTRGSETGLLPVVIILFPSPVRLLNKTPDVCVEYMDLKARIALIRQCADVAVLVVRFTASDLDDSCRSFFQLVASQIRIRELWLGASQSLGRGRQGSHDAIAALARQRKIDLRRLERNDGARLGSATLRFLSQGRIREAVRYVGTPPIWSRPRCGLLHLKWPLGPYTAVALSRPTLECADDQETLAVSVYANERGRRLLAWPRRDILWLSFRTGPGDVES